MSGFVVLLLGLSSMAGGDVASGGLGEGGDAEVDRGGAADGDLVHLREFRLGSGEADLQAFGFAEPLPGLGFGDPFDEVVSDLGQAGAFGGVGS